MTCTSSIKSACLHTRSENLKAAVYALVHVYLQTALFYILYSFIPLSVLQVGHYIYCSIYMHESGNKGSLRVSRIGYGIWHFPTRDESLYQW